MSFKFRCPHCGRKLESEDEWEGQQQCCPVCNTVITITRNIPPAPAVPPPRITVPTASAPRAVAPAPRPVAPAPRPVAPAAAAPCVSSGGGDIFGGRDPEAILSRYRLNCPGCGKMVEVMREWVDRDTVCPHCRESFTVPDGLCRKAGLAAWERAEKALEKMAPPRYSAHDSKGSLAFILLGVCFGMLGLHDFYAGYTGRGIAKLAISLFTLGMAAPLMQIWAIIELFTIKTDAQGRPFD